MLEVMEREKRKQNIILMGITECENVDEENQTLEKIMAKLVPEALVRFEVMGRVGRKDKDAKPEGGAKVRPRPVRICVEDISHRRRILARGKTLKDSEFKDIFIVPDLTKVQQEEDKKLRDKLKEIRISGRRQAKIEKGAIVDEEEGVKVVLYTPRK
jgi:hypothetical protein